MTPRRFTLSYLALGLSSFLSAQTAGKFMNLSQGTPSCPRESSSSAAHTDNRPLVDSAPEQLFPRGQRRPIGEFGVTDLEGKLTKVSDLKGRVVIIGIWSTQCDPSMKELQELRSFQFQAAEKDYSLTVLAVHMETWPQVLSFIRVKAQFFEGVKVSKAAYGANGFSQLGPEIQALPAIYLLDREGKLAATWEGYVPGRLLTRLNALYNEKPPAPTSPALP